MIFCNTLTEYVVRTYHLYTFNNYFADGNTLAIQYVDLI